MTSVPDDRGLAKVWTTDARDGMAWSCPDCDSWATLGGNAGYHAETTGHGVPSLRPRPNEPTRTEASDTEEHEIKTNLLHALAYNESQRKLSVLQLSQLVLRFQQMQHAAMHDAVSDLAKALTAKERAEAELLRLCGPPCPHDQKRASEHLCRCSGARTSPHFHFGAGVLYPHLEWPGAEEWLRRSAR